MTSRVKHSHLSIAIFIYKTTQKGLKKIGMKKLMMIVQSLDRQKSEKERIYKAYNFEHNEYEDQDRCSTYSATFIYLCYHNKPNGVNIMKDQYLTKGRYADLQEQMQFADFIFIQCTLVALRLLDKVEK